MFNNNDFDKNFQLRSQQFDNDFRSMQRMTFGVMIFYAIFSVGALAAFLYVGYLIAAMFIAR